ncbi:MAG TPA: FlgD immunoglobulin-like domain containing protein [Candidatus Kapabacteria bacterium]|nr:FlgD immunoglobulin-like domain containing protein [Candidatus Kapabacteria bacterium]
MKQRLLLLLVLTLAGITLFGSRNSYGQGSRRGEPNILSTGYYVVDSDDNAPKPWRPDYFFLDTTFQPFTWIRIQNGPRQLRQPPNGNYYFWSPDQTANPNTMDTTNNCLAGPIPIGFTWNFYGQNYDSVTISSNGYIGFQPRAIGYTSYRNVSGRNIPMYCDRNDVADLKAYPSYGPTAIIAALFADLDMIPRSDSTKVYIRTAPSLDTTYINFYNMRMIPSQPNNVENGRGNDKLFSTKFQIVMTRADTSIQINYGPFAGQVFTLPVVQAARIFQRNSTVGLMNENRTSWTSVNYGNHNLKGRWDAVVNITCPTCNKDFRQGGQYAIKFKQWKNIVRAINVDFPTRNYEVCLGTSVFPRASFENVDLINQTFKVKFQIRNAITGIAVYGRVIVLNNMGPGEIRKTQTGDFPAYSTNPNILNQLGTFNACAVAASYDANDVYIGDRWPFDDTVCIRIFGIRTTSLPFNDPSDGYSATIAYALPDQTKWVSIGADAQEGDIFTYDPPPPRYEAGSGVGPNSWLDPVIHFDRLDINGNVYGGASNLGDTLVSFPFNLAGQSKASITFDYQRAGKLTFPLYWDNNALLGPEKTITYSSGQVAVQGDSLVLEIKNPKIDPAACNPNPSSWIQIAAIDGGNDFEFRHFGINIQQFNVPPSFTYLANNFRFRLRLKANDNGAYPPDDDVDDWYVDNISLQVPRKPEIEVMWVRVVTPYTHMPMSQMVSLPVYVHLANNSSDVAIAFPVRVQILDPNQNTVYWATQTVTSLRAGTDTTITMPAWNALYAGTGGSFRVHAFLATNGYDTYTLDNGTHFDFFLDAGQPGSPPEFAYDDGGNDMPGTPLVDMFASAAGSATIVQTETGRGTGFVQLSGSLAMKFQTVTKDTLYGVRAYFASGNQSESDDIRITIFKGKAGSCVPSSDTVWSGMMQTQRHGQLFDQYWPYYFPAPIVLPPGIYWASVSQKGLNSYFLGGDISRGGGRIVVTDPTVPVIPPIYSDPFGTNIGQDLNTGDISCAFALEVVANSGNWNAYTPAAGFWPAMYEAAWPTLGGDYLVWGTYNCNPCSMWNPQTYQYTYWWNDAGMYAPMIRSMVSQSTILPINLVYLNGRDDNGKALLTWATAWEKNNQGFFVERRRVGESDEFFEKIGFVDGKGTTNTETGYSFVDRNVTPGTYTYRLIQMDLDGSQHVSNSTNVEIGTPTSFSLEQNYPNPWADKTEISFTLPEAAPTQLVVYNSLGQVVRTLVDGYVHAGTSSVSFDGKDDGGQELPTGAYLYKISSGAYSSSHKMTLTK